MPTSRITAIETNIMPFTNLNLNSRAFPILHIIQIVEKNKNIIKRLSMQESSAIYVSIRPSHMKWDGKRSGVKNTPHGNTASMMCQRKTIVRLPGQFVAIILFAWSIP